jgi:MFS transporter, MHS family, proline/betaine transporter
MAEIFPTRTRSTGIALSYNISAPIFGGFAPLISTWLIQISGNSLAPSFYLMLTALVSIGALLLVRTQLRLN